MNAGPGDIPANCVTPGGYGDQCLKKAKKKAFHEEDQKAFGERRVGRDREFYVIFAVLRIY